MFLNKIYSSLADEKKWADELEGSLLFSYGNTNSCRVTIGYTGNNKVDILDKKWTYFSIRCYSLWDQLFNPNTDTTQVATLLDLGQTLEAIKDFSDKDIVLAGKLLFFFDTSLDSHGSKPTLKKKSIAKLKNLICVTFGE